MFILPALKDRIVFSELVGLARGAGRGAPPPRMDNRSWALLMVSICFVTMFTSDLLASNFERDDEILLCARRRAVRCWCTNKYR